MAAPTMRATFDELFEDRHPYLANVMFLEYNEHPDEYSQLGYMDTSTRMKETDFMVAELGLFVQKPEGAPIQTDSIEPSFHKDFLHVTWARGVEVTMEAIEDDQDNIMADQAKALGYSARQTVELLAANAWFNLAFTTETSADGQSVYSTTHNTSGGFTISNRLAVDLGSAGLQAASTLFSDLVSEKGHKIRMEPQRLIVPTALQWVARELVESLNKPHEMSNTTNVMKGLARFVSHYISLPTSWFLWGAQSQIKAKWYWRKRPTPVKDTRYSNQSGLTGMLFRCSQGTSDFRGLVGALPGA